ncbi:hypothetical protein SODALDRAFT_326787 [Sodiomyces alkalinus F11]|uniref:MFS transporter n=1 Tax=Sodiomyces alkalinus (strain CBS 110278 / VKM F-3762 / F11) TaxID=1314773 RepID=A0A3N2Q7A2_SODAK|nr:hypothetical protein SODALDRAFT_326787 [Sodiomyces alkalinus F11]ROT42630.1 hypothetical protein SODALDRAFT_326787 [Sodiomyces alkalinus F11]
MLRIFFFVLLLAALVTLASASTPTFCKCTCFKNSTVVPLDSQAKYPSSSSSSSSSPPSSLHRRDLFSAPIFAPLPNFPFQPDATTNEKTRTRRSEGHQIARRGPPADCTKCTKAFCLAQKLPICTDATEEDVQTSCFQRDSRKDRIIVWGFIVVTGGLLGWAAARRVFQSREAPHMGVFRSLRGYAPLGRGGAQPG